jgi:hypothetical protein
MPMVVRRDGDRGRSRHRIGMDGSIPSCFVRLWCLSAANRPESA